MKIAPQPRTYEKDFDAWNGKKKKVNNNKKIPLFSEKEVWWVSIGINVGSEVDGKSDNFTRPVLIIKKFNRQLFLGIPMSTKIKKNKYYFIIRFQNRLSAILISQIKAFSSKRLKEKIGEIEGDEMYRIKRVLWKNVLSPPRPS